MYTSAANLAITTSTGVAVGGAGSAAGYTMTAKHGRFAQDLYGRGRQRHLDRRQDPVGRTSPGPAATERIRDLSERDAGPNRVALDRFGDVPSPSAQGAHLAHWRRGQRRAGLQNSSFKCAIDRIDVPPRAVAALRQRSRGAMQIRCRGWA